MMHECRHRSDKERQAQADDLTLNMHKYFGVIGLMEHFGRSLKMFDRTYGLHLHDVYSAQNNAASSKLQQLAQHSTHHSTHHSTTTP